MSEQKKPPFLWAIIGIIPIIIMAIIILGLHTGLYNYAGWSLDEEYFLLMSILTGLGIVLPVILLAINLVGFFLYEKLESFTSLIGLGTAIINGILIIACIGFSIYTFYKGADNPPDEFAFFLIEGVLMIIAACIAGFNTYFGIKIMKWK